MGTGFAQPNMKGAPMAKRTPGTNNEPIGSICFIGLILSLPSAFAVGSPSL